MIIVIYFNLVSVSRHNLDLYISKIVNNSVVTIKMLPLSHKDSMSRGIGSRMKEKLQGWMRLIFSDRNSRNLFLFLLLNLSFAFVELSYGIWTNSLGKYYRSRLEITINNIGAKYNLTLASFDAILLILTLVQM